MILFGIFQGTFIGTWINNEGANLTNGTLPSDYEEYSDGFYSIPYERAVCDKNGKDITEYFVAAAYADGAFTFTRGNGGKTVLTIPDAVSNTINDHIANKSNPHAVTKAQVGLGNVDNTADSAKSVKYAASAGSANAVAWSNVSGRPSSLPANGGNSATVNGHTVNADVPSGAKFTDTTYGAATQSANGLMSKSDKAKLDGIGAGSNVKSVNSKTGAVTLTKSDVGLSNVANYDQSKAIKSITRNGTTFTATALDGTTSTFTQQDTNTTYSIATSSADGLMSKSDKAKLDGIDLSSNNNFKNYILLGDSYAQGWTPDGSVTGWPELLHQLLKGNLYASVTQGGAGLSDKMTGIYNLTTRISELANSDNVDSIICCCGKNDINSSELIDGINNGIKNFVDTCHQKFKNAKVYIGFIGWDLNKLPGWGIGRSLDLKNGIAEYERVTSDYTYLKTDFIMRQRSYLSSDGVHPNQTGQNALAYGIKCALYGGIPSYTKPFVQHTYPDANGGGNYQIKENFEGGITFLQFTVDSAIYYHGTNENAVFGNYELTIIKNVELDYIVPSGYNLTAMQARIMLQTTDGLYYALDVPTYFKSNSDGTYDLVINITSVNHAGNNWAGGIINYFQIYSSICVANPLT